MANQKPILSITMLASDRMDTLPRCLESLTPIREAFPCELIVVDTSKNPLVHKLVTEYADKVDTFEWCNDFAKARNACLNLVEGEWFMFIDDDEWFAEPEELIAFFKSGEYKEYGSAHHRIKNFHDSEYKTFGYGWVTRLSKMWPDTAFYNKVHEYFGPHKGKTKQLYATSYHSGYIFQTEEIRKKHFIRNVELLKQVEAEKPDELRWKIHMLQEYATVQEWETMAQYGIDVLDYLWGKPGTLDGYHFAAIHIATALACNEAKQYDKTKVVYNKAADVVKNLLVARAYMESCMAASCWNLKEYEQALLYGKKYIECYEAYCENPEKYSMESMGIFVCDTFSKHEIVKVYGIILSSELRLGNQNCLYTLYPHLMWDDEFISSYGEVEADILECLMDRQDYEMLERVLNDALSTVFVRAKMMHAVLAWKDSGDKNFLDIVNVIQTLEIPVWYKEYLNLLILEEGCSREDVLEVGARFITSVPNVFGMPSEVLEVLERNGMKLEDLYIFLDFKTWTSCLNARFEELQMEQVEELRKELENSSLANDVRFYYFMMVYMEQKALVAEKNRLSFDMLTEILASFSEYTCFTYETLYGDALQQTEVEQWPEKYQAVKWLQVFFGEVGNDMKSALGCLAKVIGAYPRLADTMKYYLERIQSEILNG